VAGAAGAAQVTAEQVRAQWAMADKAPDEDLFEWSHGSWGEITFIDLNAALAAIR
jgi:hypothetical protein